MNYRNYQREELKSSKNKVWFKMSPPGGHTWCGELHFVVYHSNRATINCGFSLKTILIMTWTIEIITEKGSNFQKIKFGSILRSHRALRSASRRFSLEILKLVKFEMVLELCNSVIWTGNWILSGNMVLECSVPFPFA